MEMMVFLANIMAALFLSMLIIMTIHLIVRKPNVGVPVTLIFIIGAMIFLFYVLDREEKVTRYCEYFPNEKVCKVKDTNKLSKEQKDKMVQRVKEEEKKMKTNIQDIEIK